MSSPPTIVDRYFTCWQRHDVAGLKKFFAVDATYEISDQKTIDGIKNIESYWIRNKQRQQKLQVDHTCLPASDRYLNAIFQARFHDREEGQFQVVSGIVCLELTADRQSISHLRETYIKTAVRERPATPTFQQYALRVWRIARRHFAQAGPAVGSVLISAAVILLILFIGSLLLLHQPTPPQWIVQPALWFFGPPQAGQSPAVLDVALSRAREVTALAITLLIGIGVPLVATWHSYRRAERRSIRTKSLDYPGHDLNLMDRAYKGADSVVVFSGDFSFLREHEKLCDKVAHFVEEKKITMISSKSRSDVHSQLANDLRTRELFEQMEAQGAIHYDVPLPIKCSLISHRARRQILYKYRAPGVGEEEMMCIFTETEQSRYLIDALDRVFNYVLKGR